MVKISPISIALNFRPFKIKLFCENIGNVYLVRLFEFSYSVRSVDQKDSQMSIMTHKWLLIIYESEMMTHHSALRALSKLIPPGP